MRYDSNLLQRQSAKQSADTFIPISLGASYLGEVPQSVNAIALTLSGVCWQIPYAINQASAIRIGNLLGANLPHKANRASQAARYFALVVTGISAVAIQVFRNSLGHLFTKDLDVITMFDRMVGHRVL